MADAPRLSGSSFWIKNAVGEWEDLSPKFIEFDWGNDYEYNYNLPPKTITISGTGSICSLQFEEWYRGVNPTPVPPSPWVDDLSFRAITVAANTLENDSWVPIDNDGRLPYAAWI